MKQQDVQIVRKWYSTVLLLNSIWILPDVLYVSYGAGAYRPGQHLQYTSPYLEQSPRCFLESTCCFQYIERSNSISKHN